MGKTLSRFLHCLGAIAIAAQVMYWGWGRSVCWMLIWQGGAGAKVGISVVGNVGRSLVDLAKRWYRSMLFPVTQDYRYHEILSQVSPLLGRTPSFSWNAFVAILNVNLQILGPLTKLVQTVLSFKRPKQLEQQYR